MMLIISWIAAIAGSVYPIPQLTRILKQQNAHGISRKFVAIWLIDKICTLILMCHLMNYPMIFKYSIGLICVSVIAWYRFFKKDIEDNI